MKYLGAISNDYDMVNKKYVDNKTPLFIEYGTANPENIIGSAVEDERAVFCYDSNGNIMPLLNSNDVDAYQFSGTYGNAGYTQWATYDNSAWTSGYYYSAMSSQVPVIVTYATTVPAGTLSNAIANNQPIFCRIDEDPDFNLIPLTYYDVDDDIYKFAGVIGDGYGQSDGSIEVIWAAWDGGWDDHGAYTISSGSGGGGNPTTWYGTCSTTASTTAKAVTISGFTSSDFKAGTIIGIMFTTANTAATPTLNINSLSAKSISIAGTAISSTTNVLKWSANTMIYFMYDGSYWHYMYANAAASTTQPRGANTWYGTSSTAATTQAKTSTIDNFVLTKGSIVVINFSTANTYSSAKITLNINSTGAKDVYYKNAATSSTNKPLWKANSTVTFVYSGSYYYIVNINPIPNDQIPDADEIPFVPRSQNWQDPLYDQALGETIGTSLENSLEFTYHSIIQVYNDTSQSVAVESGAMAFVPFNAIYYKNDVNGVFSLDSTGGVKVHLAGYYRVSGSICGSTNSQAIATSGTANNYRRGLYVYVGTSPSTTDCVEWVSHVEYSPGSVAFGIASQIIYANQNDIIYLVFRPMGMAGNYNPGLLRQSFLNIERLPSPYPTS